MSEQRPDPTTDENSSDSGGTDPGGNVGIDDDQLPEDLQPTDDNPLAKPPEEGADEDSGMSLGPDGPGAETASPG